MRKNIIGVIIIVLAFVLIFGWEFYGREQFSYKPTLVVTATVEKGQTITSNLLAERRLPQEALVDGSMVMQDVSQLVGKVAKHYMARNSQITINDVYEKDLYIKGNESIYKIPSKWISSISSTVRRGDIVAIYDASGLRLIGEYRVAFVKDSSEREITNDDGTNHLEEIDRVASSGVPASLEIITTVSEYRDLYQTSLSSSLLVVQKIK